VMLICKKSPQISIQCVNLNQSFQDYFTINYANKEKPIILVQSIKLANSQVKTSESYTLNIHCIIHIIL